MNDPFEHPADILAFLLGLDDRVAKFRNVLERLLNLPDGTGDAGGRLIIGSPRQDADQFLEHVDCAVGQMAGKMQDRCSQHGVPAFGVEVAQMLRAHPHPFRGEFVENLGRNALHQFHRQVQ